MIEFLGMFPGEYWLALFENLIILYILHRSMRIAQG